MSRVFKISFVLVFLSLNFHQSLADKFASVLEECKNSCERSYPLHTYPKEEPLYACKQGCRLSAIEQLQAGGNSNDRNFTQACIAGCQDGFKEKDNKFACIIGCKSLDVIPSPELYNEEAMPDHWSFRTYLVYVYPVLDVSKYCHGFLNRVGYYYRISSSYYYSYREGDSIVVEINEQPQELIITPQNDEVQYVENDLPQETSDSDETGSYPSKVVDKGRQWLHCVSQRSGLPFWLLTSMLFLSIFFLLWLCCATATTAPKEKIKASVIHELMLLDDDSLLEKVPLVKADDKDEAGPLPVKVHIDATRL